MPTTIWDFSVTRPVRCTVGSEVVGRAIVESYDIHDKVGPRNGHFYIVPLYPMRLVGRDKFGAIQFYDFKVLRFGVSHNAGGPDFMTGKSKQGVSTLTWSDFLGGSWKLSEYEQVYLHKGPEFPLNRDLAVGAAGCIEVAGHHKWIEFNKRVRELSGSSNLTHIGLEGKFKCELLPAHCPHLQKALAKAA